MSFPELPPEDALIEPGIYDGTDKPWVHPSDYHASARLSRSQLVKLIEKSPAHFRWALDHPEPPTPAMILGDAIHSAVLEPERFAAEYALAPMKWNKTLVGDREDYYSWLIDACAYTDMGTKTIKNGAERLILPEPGPISKTPVSYDDSKVVTGISLAVHRNPAVRAMFAERCSIETSVAWDIDRGKRGTARMRARSDSRYIGSTGPIVGDLKSAEDGSASAFRREIANRKLHVQVALYLDGWTAATGIPHNTFVFIIYEKTDFYECAVRPMEAEAIEIGRREYEAALDTYLDCSRTNEWPGYGMEPTGLPAWYAKTRA